MRFYPLLPRHLPRRHGLLLLVLGLTALTSCGGAASPLASNTPTVPEPTSTEPPASTPIAPLVI
jgi:hypothetical protein